MLSTKVEGHYPLCHKSFVLQLNVKHWISMWKQFNSKQYLVQNLSFVLLRFQFQSKIPNLDGNNWVFMGFFYETWLNANSPKGKGWEKYEMNLEYSPRKMQ